MSLAPLRQLVREAREALLDDDLGQVVAEMQDLLASVGLVLQEDLELDEYVQTLYHLDAVLDGRDLAETYGFGAIGKLAGDATRSLRKGFKMVFGKLAKISGKSGSRSAGNPHAKSRRSTTRPAVAANRHRKARGQRPVPAARPPAKRKRKRTAAQRQRGHRTASAAQGATARGTFTTRS